MSATQTIELAEKLVEAKIPKETATELLDYIQVNNKEKDGDSDQKIEIIEQDVSVLKQDVNVLKQDVGILKQDVNVLKQDVNVLKQDVNVLKQDVNWLKWIMGLGFTITFAVMIYLHSDTKTEMNKLSNRMDRIEMKLDRLLEKQR